MIRLYCLILKSTFEIKIFNKNNNKIQEKQTSLRYNNLKSTLCF